MLTSAALFVLMFVPRGQLAAFGNDLQDSLQAGDFPNYAVSMSTSIPNDPSIAKPNEAVRTLVSLFVFIHLFCVATVLSSNFSPSPLQERLVGILAPYTRTLHLDPNFVPYHMTSGEPADRFHQWVVQLPDGKTLLFPSRKWRGGFPRKRLETMAQVAAFYAENEMDEVPAEMARGLADHAIAVSQSDGSQPLLVRCLRFTGNVDPESAEADDDPSVNVVYAADVWRNRQGTMSVLKRSPAGQVAPPVRDTQAGQD